MKLFADEMDRFFEDFGIGRNLTRLGQMGRELVMPDTERIWLPAVEVFERDGRLVVRADLPGLSKDEVKVEITGRELIIEGERRQEHEENREGFYRSELVYGSFYRSIPLPEGADAQAAKASFKDGVLEVEIPLEEEKSETRRLEVK